MPPASRLCAMGTTFRRVRALLWLTGLGTSGVFVAVYPLCSEHPTRAKSQAGLRDLGVGVAPTTGRGH
jgi:hypothetical protein